MRSRLDRRLWFFLLVSFLVFEVLFVLIRTPSEAAFIDYSRQLVISEDINANLTRALLFVTLVQKVIFFVPFPKNLQIFNLVMSWVSVILVYRISFGRSSLDFPKFFLLFKVVSFAVSPTLFLTTYGLGREGLSIALLVAIFSIAAGYYKLTSKLSLIMALAYFVYKLRDIDIVAATLAVVVGFVLYQRSKGNQRFAIAFPVMAGVVLFILIFIFLATKPTIFLMSLDEYGEGGSSYMIGYVRTLADVFVNWVFLAFAFGFFVPANLFSDNILILAATLIGIIQFIAFGIYLLYTRSKLLISLSFLFFIGFFAYGVFVRNFGSALRWSTSIDILIVLTLIFLILDVGGNERDR